MLAVMSREPTAESPDREPIPRRVLLATDASAASASAEGAAIELAARLGASLIIVSVIDQSRLRLPGGPFHTRVDQVRAERESAVIQIVREAQRRNVQTEFLIWQGDPGPTIVDAADSERADAIVLGSHVRGPIGRLLLGSVSRFVTEHARVPVNVVRPGQHLDNLRPTDPIDGSEQLGSPSGPG